MIDKKSLIYQRDHFVDIRKIVKLFEFQQVHDCYAWLKEKCHWNEILQAEAISLQKYLELNTQKNDWPEIRKLFQTSIDYEIYFDVQYLNGDIFYSYKDFSKSIFKS